MTAYELTGMRTNFTCPFVLVSTKGILIDCACIHMHFAAYIQCMCICILLHMGVIFWGGGGLRGHLPLHISHYAVLLCSDQLVNLIGLLIISHECRPE